MEEYLNLLITPKGAFVCASMACATAISVIAPIQAPKRRRALPPWLRSMGNHIGLASDALFGGVAAASGFLALGQWCLPEGTRLVEVAAALGLVGTVLNYHWRKRLEGLAGDPVALERVNRKLKTASWSLMPVSLALLTYTTLFA